MGCCGTSNALTYKHNMTSHTVTKAQMVIIKKWAGGALARRRFKKMVQANYYTSLKKPSFQDGKLEMMQQFFTEDDIAYQMSYEGDGKGLYWDTKLKDIKKERLYFGQWKATKRESQW